jgi:hypothetical protein
MGFRAGLGAVEKKSLLHQGSNPNYQARGLVTILTELLWLPYIISHLIAQNGEGSRSGNAVRSYSWDTRLKSRSEHWLYWLRIFVILPSSYS